MSNMSVDIVTSCVGCTTPANFVATLTLIAIVVMITWLKEWRTADRAIP